MLRCTSEGDEKKEGKKRREKVKCDFFGFLSIICMYIVHSAVHLHVYSLYRGQRSTLPCGVFSHNFDSSLNGETVLP